ncbi:AraC family transcriptional regulator [Actinoplanes sp. Pm04-4]|uniref:AraC family transcriptional regulator n=1 Tax=Paractinoplanes pyxinae TaxID=2997416 RepID=A0ABT4B7M8_9ACTN|nr:AraC family transcriptional regulator [Actinoplanes pyxinae]MCY1141613.1 AraC family transcriptional regulator [Actinoplanes pyxinae]
MSEVLSASGLDDVEQLISDQYVAVRLRPGPTDPTLTIEQDRVGSVIVGSMAYGMNVDIDAEPMGALGIVYPRSGHATYRSRGEERPCGPGELCVAAYAGDGFAATQDYLDCDFVILDPALLSDVASTAPGIDEPVRLTGYRALSSHATAIWLDTAAFVRTLSTRPDNVHAPLIDRQAARLLAAATLAAFPSNTLADPTTADRHDAHPQTLRRAIAFIDDNADRDLSVADIARAAYVTTRAIQLVFRRHLDTTPMEYLRRVRLEHAHRDLQAADVSRETVGVIAARWGFANHSRFTATYHRLYGVTPSQTLRS